MVDRNVIAIDAAGLVMPSTVAESPSDDFSCFAAEAYLDFKHNSTPLSLQSGFIPASEGLKNSLRPKNLGYLMFQNDVITEVLLRILGPIGGIKRAMECDRPLWVI